MKITKQEFENIMAEAVAKEMHEFADKTSNGTGAFIIALMGASLTHKVVEALFENNDEIEIITDKE